jgi:hypothetical protein
VQNELTLGVGVMVSRVIDAPVDLVWRVFVDPARRRAWTSDVDSVSLTVLEPGRRCRVQLLGPPMSHQRDYVFASIDIGPHRGGTVVTAVDERTAGFAERLLDLVAGGFTARTVEGAVRAELEALRTACTTSVIALAA